jgi:hypothetical protein
MITMGYTLSQIEGEHEWEVIGWQFLTLEARGGQGLFIAVIGRITISVGMFRHYGLHQIG